jgi:UDP-MurNAc hydroxylase
VRFVACSGDASESFTVDLWRGTVDTRPAAGEPFEIRTSAYVLNQCIGLHLFSHLPISKRVRFKVTRRTMPLMKALILLLMLYEYDYLPLRDLDWPRLLETARLRWREIVLYGEIAADLLFKRRFDRNRWLGLSEE